jgi:hypothetical protein
MFFFWWSLLIELEDLFQIFDGFIRFLANKLKQTRSDYYHGIYIITKLFLLMGWLLLSVLVGRVGLSSCKSFIGLKQILDYFIPIKPI